MAFKSQDFLLLPLRDLQLTTQHLGARLLIRQGAGRIGVVAANQWMDRWTNASVVSVSHCIHEPPSRIESKTAKSDLCPHIGDSLPPPLMHPSFCLPSSLQGKGPRLRSLMHATCTKPATGQVGQTYLVITISMSILSVGYSSQAARPRIRTWE